MKDMKQLINKWGESMLFSLLMALCAGNFSGSQQGDTE